MEHRSQKLIYVVDDEAVIASTITAILQRSGYHAHAFTRPREALTSAVSVVPDLVLTDVMMDEMSGVKLAIELRSSCPTCKVVLFSGNAFTTDLLKEARELGMSFELLAKPIPPDKLLGAIRRLTAD